MDISLVALSLVVREKDLVRDGSQFIVGRNGILEISRKTEQLGKNFPFRGIRESPKLLDEMLRFRGHDRFYRSKYRDIPTPLQEMRLVRLTSPRFTGAGDAQNVK
jgi:hypothetical protein